MMKTTILTPQQIEQKINRLAFQVYENNYKEEEIVIAGISGKGFLLAKRIAAKLEQISPFKLMIGELKINKDHPLSEPVGFPFKEKELKGKAVFLVDDVINSGRTMIYGVKYLLNFPLKQLRTIVMVERSHNIFPIRADYVGLKLSTTLQDHVSVELEKGRVTVYLQ